MRRRDLIKGALALAGGAAVATLPDRADAKEPAETLMRLASNGSGYISPPVVSYEPLVMCEPFVVDRDGVVTLQISGPVAHFPSIK